MFCSSALRQDVSSEHITMLPPYFVKMFMILILFVLPRVSLGKQSVNIVVMYSGCCGLESISDTYTIAKYWENHLVKKYQTDPNWPFMAQIEYMDVMSDADNVKNFLTARIHNKSLPNVTAIIGPEIEYLGYAAGATAAQYGIPCVLGTANPDDTVVGRPSYLATSFLIQPAVSFLHKEIINTYVVNGVSSMVVVYAGGDNYDQSSCYGAAELASSRGILIKAKLEIPENANNDDILSIVRNIKNNFNPDAVMWCDWAACTIPTNVQQYNPLPAFKTENYMPKAINMLDCLDQPSIQSLVDGGYMMYVSQGMKYHPYPYQYKK